MSLRLSKFQEYKTHAWHKRNYKLLSSEQLAWARDWIKKHDHLNKGEFELACNRMFLDRAIPKNGSAIQELISSTNVNVPHPPEVQAEIDERKERFAKARGW